MRRTGSYLLLALVLAIFAAFLLWPIYQVVRVAFFGVPGDANAGGFTLGYFKAIFLDADLRRGLINSALIAVGVTTVCILISVPLAVLSVRYDFRGKAIVNALLLVPLILPPFVGAIGMRQILGRFGALTAMAHDLGFVDANTPIDWFGNAQLLGIILVESLALYPILLLNVAAALANIDPAMEQAAANLGASRWTIFRKITLPLMRPGLFAGGTIVLIWSFTELGTPLMFDFYDVTPVQIFHRLTQVTGNPLPYALVVVMLLASMALYVVGKFVLGRRQDAGVTKASVQSTASPLRGSKALLALAPFLLVGGLALLPHVGVLLMSVSGVGAWYQSELPRIFTAEHYAHALTHDFTMPSVRNSVVFASASMALDIVLGLMIAWLIVRSTLPGRRMIDGLAMLPLAVPGVVLAFGYLAISLELQTWVGRDRAWLRDLVDVQQNPTVLLIVAYAMRRLPYVVRSAVAGLEQTPVDLELAARNLGASNFFTLRRITVPLIAANLLAGGLLAFAFAMLEVSDSLILAQRQSYWPITKAIYELFQRLGDGPYIASALGVWAMALLTLTILSASALLGKRMGAIFRV
ncbi:MAG: iron(III) transport system permease protein [Phycisphaerales bacterium]|nr:iron(III) transport system permease protein [Phycisphaerales bacterium]